MSGPVDTLEEIAADKGNWRIFGVRLLGAMADPSLHGFSRSDEVLAEVARLRGQTSESLMNSVRAARYLVEHMPSELRKLRDGPSVGLSHVNLLARLDKIDNEETQTLRVRVFNGEMSYRELAAKVREIQERAAAEVMLQAGAPERILGRKRARSFEWTVKNFLMASVKILTGKPGAIVRTGHKMLPIPVDHIIWNGGDPVIAIEVKAPRRNFRQSVLIEMLGTCSLLQRRIPEVWLITPRGWEGGLEKISSIAVEMQLTGLRFFTFDETEASSGISALREIPGAGDRPTPSVRGQTGHRGKHQA